MTLPIRPLHPEIARCQPWRGRGRWFGRGSGRVGGAQRRLRGRGAGAVHRGQRAGIHRQPQRAVAGLSGELSGDQTSLDMWRLKG